MTITRQDAEDVYWRMRNDPARPVQAMLPRWLEASRKGDKRGLVDWIVDKIIEASEGK
jgi:hypothetical protein